MNGLQFQGERRLQQTIALLKAQFVDGIKFGRAADTFISLALGREPKHAIDQRLAKLLESENAAGGERLPLRDAVIAIAFGLAMQRALPFMVKASSASGGIEDVGRGTIAPEFKDAFSCAELFTPELLANLPAHYGLQVSKLFNMKATALHLVGDYGGSWEFYSKMLETNPEDAGGVGGRAALMADWILNHKPETRDAAYIEQLRQLFDDLTFALKEERGTGSMPARQSHAAVGAELADLESDAGKKKELLKGAASDILAVLGMMTAPEERASDPYFTFSCYYNLGVAYLELAKLGAEGSGTRRDHLENARDYNELAKLMLAKLPEQPPRYVKSVADCRKGIDELAK